MGRKPCKRHTHRILFRQSYKYFCRYIRLAYSYWHGPARILGGPARIYLITQQFDKSINYGDIIYYPYPCLAGFLKARGHEQNFNENDCKRHLCDLDDNMNGIPSNASLEWSNSANNFTQVDNFEDFIGRRYRSEAFITKHEFFQNKLSLPTTPTGRSECNIYKS